MAEGEVLSKAMKGHGNPLEVSASCARFSSEYPPAKRQTVNEPGTLLELEKSLQNQPGAPVDVLVSGKTGSSMSHDFGSIAKKGRISRACSKVSMNQKQGTSLVAELQNLQSELDHRAMQLAEAHTCNAQLSTQLDKLQACEAIMDEAFQTQARLAARKMKHVEELQSIIAAQSATQQAEKHSLHTEELATVRQLTVIIWRVKQSAAEEAATLNTEIAALRTELSPTTALLTADAEAARHFARAKLARAQNEVEQVHAQLTQANAKLSQAALSTVRQDAKVMQKSRQLAQQERQSNLLALQIQAQEDLLRQKEAQISASVSELGNLKEQLTFLTSQTETNVSLIRHQEAELSTVTAELGNKDAMLARTQHQLDVLISQLEANVRHADAESCAHRAEIAAKDAAITTLKQSLAFLYATQLAKHCMPNTDSCILTTKRSPSTSEHFTPTMKRSTSPIKRSTPTINRFILTIKCSTSIMKRSTPTTTLSTKSANPTAASSVYDNAVYEGKQSCAPGSTGPTVGTIGNHCNIEFADTVNADDDAHSRTELIEVFSPLLSTGK